MVETIGNVARGGQAPASIRIDSSNECKLVEKTETEDETKAVADYYKVLNNMLSIFDVEKLYIVATAGRIGGFVLGISC